MMKLIEFAFCFSTISFCWQNNESYRTETVANRIMFSLPNTLKKLTRDEISVEVPNVNQRPTELYKSGRLKLSINYGATNAKEKDLPAIENYFENIYKRLPNARFIGSYQTIINNKKFVIMKFEASPNVNEDKVFNYFFATVVNGKLFMGDYSFPSQQLVTQEKQAEGILNSFRIK